MKMRTLGYTQVHRLNDPYKFWAKLLDTPPKRRRRGIATWTYVSRLDDETIRFTMGNPKDALDDQKLLCTLSSNDVWTIHVKPNELAPSDGNRISALTGIYCAANRKDYGNYENPYRIYENRVSYPYVQGVQVYKGKIVDKEQYVDRKRVIGDKSAALDVKRKLKKIYEVAPIMVRLLNAAHPERKEKRWWEKDSVKAELFARIDVDNITAQDAEDVYLLGECTTSKKQKWVWVPPGQAQYIALETDAEFQHRCIVNGLRKLREHIYSKEGVYQYEQVEA